MIRGLVVLVAISTVLASQGKQCGRVQVEQSGLSDRVLGGHVAQKRNWPWLVTTRVCTKKCSSCTTMCGHCTGTIISDRHILSAGHCFKDIERDVVVTVTSPHSVGKVFKSESMNVTVHPKYKQKGFPGYDVAIVELRTPIPFSDYDQPICIVDSFREDIGDVGYVAGYGASSVNRIVPPSDPNTGVWNITYNDPDGQAYENIVQFRTLERCSSVTFPVATMIRHSERTICAVGNKRDTAKGDSGGPLMINRKGVWYQVGTTSIGTMFKDDDGEVKWFSLYTRLSRACDWIDEVTSGDVKCALMDD